MLLEHDRIALTADIPDQELKAGGGGAIVHIYPQRAAYEVELFSPDGNTAAVARVPRENARPVTEGHITHARSVNTAASSSRLPPSPVNLGRKL